MKEPGKTLKFRISAAFVRRFFLLGPWIFSGLGLASELLGKNSEDPDFHGIVPLFSLSHEGNIPTLFQVFVLASCAIMLALIARTKRLDGDRWRRQWMWLAIGFTYVAFDEWVSLHELLNDVLKLQGMFFFGWVVPFGIAAIVAGLSFIPFLLGLPRRLAARFVLAGVIYVAGAIGMELPLGYWTYEHGMDNLGYALIDWTEESLEMIGAGLFAASVFGVFRRSVGALHVEVPPAEGTEPADASARTPARSS